MGFFDYPLVCNETVKFLDFLHRDSYQGKITLRLLLLVRCRLACPVMPRPNKICQRVDLGWFRDGIATLKIVQNEKKNEILKRRKIFFLSI